MPLPPLLNEMAAAAAAAMSFSLVLQVDAVVSAYMLQHDGRLLPCLCHGQFIRTFDEPLTLLGP